MPNEFMLLFTEIQQNSHTLGEIPTKRTEPLQMDVKS
jgi:hypothetical protein